MSDDDRIKMTIGPVQPVDRETALTDLVADMTLLIGKIDLGLQAALDALPDEEARAKVWADAHKEAIGAFYEGAQKYTTAIIAGGYAAYFTALSLLSGRFSDQQLSAATLSITVSLSIFVLHEIFSVGITTYRGMRGTLEEAKGGKAIGVVWGISFLASIVAALPAMGLMFYVCIKHLVN